jgi:hypothetical protein
MSANEFMPYVVVVTGAPIKPSQVNPYILRIKPPAPRIARFAWVNDAEEYAAMKAAQSFWSMSVIDTSKHGSPVVRVFKGCVHGR